MAAFINRFGREDDQHELQQDLLAIGPTDPIKMARGDVVVQIGGVGTVTGIVERCTRDPKDPNWAPVEDAPFDGEIGKLAARVYSEPGVAYWRFRVIEKNDTVKVSIMGLRA